jgi:hypothetical protein
MMNELIIALSIIQTVSVSLGVGSSTIAILNFFQAIRDGVIDAAERGMMGVTYIVLRIAMVLILTTTVLLTGFGIVGSSTTFITTYISAQLALIGVLFINAILMTKRLMPSTLGPAIQASTWYTLGFTVALVPLKLHTYFTFWQFFTVYVSFMVLMILLVNLVMRYLKEKKATLTPSK